jgi:hypothetical protein
MGSKIDVGSKWMPSNLLGEISALLTNRRVPGDLCGREFGRLDSWLLSEEGCGDRRDRPRLALTGAG